MADLFREKSFLVLVGLVGTCRLQLVSGPIRFDQTVRGRPLLSGAIILSVKSRWVDE